MKIQPVVFFWRRVDVVDEKTGEATRVLAMVPHPRYGNVAARQYGEEGSEHTLMPFEERSLASHNQYFAALNDHYDNLREDVCYITDAAGKFVLQDGHKIPRWPSPQHFRKDLLIMTGWCDTKEIECATRRHAMLLATFVRTESEYAKIKVAKQRVQRVDPDDGKPYWCWPVTVQVAKSQSHAAMGKRDFEQSKKDVLDLAESFTGISRSQAMKNAGRSA